MINNIVFYHSLTEEPYTTVDVIAEYAGVKRKSVNELIRTHKADLEEFGVLPFEMAKLDGRGRPRKNWHLNEKQVTFLFGLLDNTPQVVEFLKALTKAFFDVSAKARAAEREIERKNAIIDILKPVNKSLSEVVADWWPNNSHAYPLVHNLALKMVTGMRAQGIKKKFGVKNAKDALTTAQLEQLERVKELIKQLILNGYSYDELKDALNVKAGA